jgi:hypothetical protein
MLFDHRNRMMEPSRGHESEAEKLSEQSPPSRDRADRESRDARRSVGSVGSLPCCGQPSDEEVLPLKLLFPSDS